MDYYLNEHDRTQRHYRPRREPRPRHYPRPEGQGAGEVWRQARIAAKAGDPSKLRALSKARREGRIDPFGRTAEKNADSDGHSTKVAA